MPGNGYWRGAIRKSAWPSLYQRVRIGLSNKFVLLGFVAAVTFFVWNLPTPPGVTPSGIPILAVFLFTLLGIIMRPLPIGSLAVLGITLALVSRSLTPEEAFSGFNSPVVWLIVTAFFISRGLIKTGLGERIAYGIIRLTGKSTLGMSYGFVLTDLLLAPAIPSMTARVGGIIYPVIRSLAQTFGSTPEHRPRKLGAFLTKTSFQTSIIIAGMFMTSCAGNPLIAGIVKSSGVSFSWGLWALAASVPALVALAVIPLVLYFLYPPEIRSTPNASGFAKTKLKEMGTVRAKEWTMIVSFVLLVLLWAIGPYIRIQTVTIALLGLSVLLLTGVLEWDDITSEKGAWNTLIWFSVLVMLAGALYKSGLMDWFGSYVRIRVKGCSWVTVFIVLTLVYFYSHYFFASMIAHIGSMFAPFFLLLTASGVPPFVAVLGLGMAGSLFGGLTHYGCGIAPIFFGGGYVKLSDWWRLGFLVSIINIVIYFTVGVLWWHCLGFFAKG